jgi:hypothetical protein
MLYHLAIIWGISPKLHQADVEQDRVVETSRKASLRQALED